MSFVNPHSVSLLRYVALGGGLWYGSAHYQHLKSFVEERKKEHHRQEYLDRVEEGKVAFDAQVSREWSKMSKHDGIPSVDPDSFNFDAEKFVNWIIPVLERSEKEKVKSSEAKK